MARLAPDGDVQFKPVKIEPDPLFPKNETLQMESINDFLMLKDVRCHDSLGNETEAYPILCVCKELVMLDREKFSMYL